jgi:hypothetical protein
MKSQSKKMLLRRPHQGLNFWRACRGDNLKTSRNITMNGFDCSEAFPLPPNITRTCRFLNMQTLNIEETKRFSSKDKLITCMTC